MSTSNGTPVPASFDELDNTSLTALLTFELDTRQFHKAMAAHQPDSLVARLHREAAEFYTHSIRQLEADLRSRKRHMAEVVIWER